MVIGFYARVQAIEVKVRGKESPLDHGGAFEDTCEARAALKVADDRLDRSHIHRIVRASNVLTEALVDGGSFLWISCLSASPMRFKKLLSHVDQPPSHDLHDIGTLANTMESSAY